MDNRPNIIFMLTDDQRFDAFGFSSEGVVITPNLDQMAEEGVVFDNAYHVSPICMPSRASIHMGRYISDHQCGFEKPYCKTVTEEEFEQSYPVKLKEAGYYTGFIGKFGYAVTENKIDSAEFALGQRIYPDGYKRFNAVEHSEYAMPKEFFDVWYGATGQSKYRSEREGFINGHPNPWHAEHATEHNGHQAVDFIKEALAKGQPFNLNISFKAPHNPLDPMKRHLDLYQDKVIPRYENDTPYHHSLLPEVVRNKSRNPEYYFNTGEWKDWASGTWEIDANYQKDIKKYYALITGVDEVVGQIRETLDELGIAENTVLIYTSDNGMFCGSRQIHGKAILYEESIKAPMIIYDPRLSSERKGASIDGLISHVDIAPTILSYAGMSPNKSYKGVSFKEMVEGTKDKVHQYVFGENNFNNFFKTKGEVADPTNYQSIRSRYVRSESYKLIRYYECEPIIEELFNVNEDVFEEENLVGNPTYEKVYEELSVQLNTFAMKS